MHSDLHSTIIVNMIKKRDEQTARTESYARTDLFEFSLVGDNEQVRIALTRLRYRSQTAASNT